MERNCVSTTRELMYRCTSAFFVCSSKNHVSLADMVMVGPGKLMVGPGKLMVGPGKLMVGHRP